MLFTERTLAIANSLSNEQCGLLFRRLLEYTAGNDNPTDDQMVEFSFKVLKVDLDDSAEKFKALCEKRREAGRKHKGNQYTRNNEANGTSVPITEQMEQVQANGTISNSNSNSNSTSTIVEDNSSNEEFVKKEEGITSNTSSTEVDAVERIDYTGLMNFWNLSLGKYNSSLPQIQKMTEDRQRKVRSLIKKYGKETFWSVLQTAMQSDFLNSGKFNCGFDWIIKPANFVKILEGNYKNKRATNTTDSVIGDTFRKMFS